MIVLNKKLEPLHDISEELKHKLCKLGLKETDTVQLGIVKMEEAYGQSSIRLHTAGYIPNV